MKSLIISDIHASYRILSSLIDHFGEDKKITSVIFAGDLVDMGEPVSFVDEFLWTLEQLKWQLIWVPGNNDFGRAYHRLNARIKSVEGKIYEYGGRKFTGVGGSPASWSGQYQGERAVDKKAIADTIFVSHVPPPGLANFEKIDKAVTNDQVTITKQITDPKNQISNGTTMKQFNNETIVLSDSPKAHICGHIHHTWGVGYLGSTKVIKLAGAYLGYYATMDLESLKVEFGRLWK